MNILNIGGMYLVYPKIKTVYFCLMLSYIHFCSVGLKLSCGIPALNFW